MDSTTNVAHEFIPPSNTLTTSPPDCYPDPSSDMHISKLLASGSLLTATVAALQRPFSIELDTPHNDTEGAIRRLRGFESSDLTVTIAGHPDILTVYDLVRNAVEQWSDKDCLGSRRLVKQISEEKMITKFINGVETQVPKKWYYSELSPYQYRTYNDLEIEMTAIGAGLRHIGLNAGDKVGLYADTSAEWQLFAQGCVSQSLPIVTAYAALGKEGLTHSLQQTKAKAIFTDAPLLKNLLEIISSTSLQHVIWNGTADDSTLRSLTKIRQIKNVIFYDDLVELGTRNSIAPTPPKASDVACIMYTSGSTGAPKGVVLTHANVISAVAGVDNALASDPKLKVDENDRFLCFLPLAHILEFVYELCAIHWGGTIGYGNPRTLLTDMVRNCEGDIQEFKPTVLVAVPAVWEKVKKGIDAKIAEQNFLLRGIFWSVYHMKAKLAEWGWGIHNTLNPVFKKIRQGTGGNVRLTVCGGAPLAKDTQKFLSITHAPLLVGYGLTETTAMAAISTPETLEYGAVGVPTSSIEIKLVDVPEMGYLHTNTPSQGEIWLRGPTVASGYYMNDEETGKAFTSDGWFTTGDVGQWEPSGTLVIIDRIKNLVKTLNGEYIALEKLESAYRTAKLVENVCVYAFPSKAKPIAIVVPSEKPLRSIVEKNNLANKHTDLSELVKLQSVQDIVMKDMIASGNLAGLQGIELVSGIILTSDIWTPENGLVTAAMKLSRKNIERLFEKEIQDVLATTD